MARREMGPEELRSIKESVNKEGTQMEEGEEGGAAVYVGSKEEVTKARQLAETEGKAPDMASYIVKHKEIFATPEELVDMYGSELVKGILGSDVVKTFEKVPTGAATIRIDELDGKIVSTVHYKDSSGNLAKVQIDLTKITALQSKVREHPDSSFIFQTTESELTKLGFRMDFNLDLNLIFKGWDNGVTERAIKQYRLKKVTKEKQGKGFAF